MSYRPSEEDKHLGHTSIGVREDVFAEWVRANRELGYGRMMQIISRIWDEAHPGFGEAHLAHNMSGRRTPEEEAVLCEVVKYCRAPNTLSVEVRGKPLLAAVDALLAAEPKWGG